VLLGLWLDTVVGGDHEHGVVCLTRARDHVLHEVPVTRTVHDCEVVRVRVELLMGDVDGDPALALLREVVHHVGELESALSFLLCLFLVLLDDVLRYVLGLVQQPSDQCALSVIDVADDGQILVWFVAHDVLTRSCATQIYAQSFIKPFR